MYRFHLYDFVCSHSLVDNLMSLLVDKLMAEDLAIVVDGSTPEARLKARWLQGYKTGKRVQVGRLLKFLDDMEIYNIESAEHQSPFKLPYRELREMILEKFL